MTSIADPRPGVIGRDDELAAGDRFLDALDRGRRRSSSKASPASARRRSGRRFARVRWRAVTRSSPRNRSSPRPSSPSPVCSTCSASTSICSTAPRSAASRARDRAGAHRTGAKREGRQSCRLGRLPFAAHPHIEGIAGRHRDRRPAVARHTDLSGGLVRGSAAGIAACRSPRIRPRPVRPRPRQSEWSTSGSRPIGSGSGLCPWRTSIA